ncbi:MAG: hypothetical protein K0U66_08405 [Gammaproteobacteria bacterium]|nr:hypothetical protein [Gammaproteobacteria bacterium]
MNGRLYHAHTGRLLRADPHVESPYGDPQTLNRYSYGRKNPSTPSTRPGSSVPVIFGKSSAPFD